ncbi:MAG TPA: DEAD/DEAH box helicase [Pseudobdellovibrionaceae bacterium]|nr:DEAD/DEAH box helicase [Pseudobdellovibrionaceae bacterium]
MENVTTTKNAAEEIPVTPNLFETYSLSSLTLKALKDLQFQNPTDIQQKVIPALMTEAGNDLIALAETGSGKTGAYGIPLIEKIDTQSKKTQALVLCPTRELAIQVSDQVQKLGKYKNMVIATIYGGASYRPQEMALRKGAHVIIATPGRLIDFLDQGRVKLGDLNVLVLDEADEMMSMGFQEALERVLKESSTSSKKWLFSATMSREIRSVAEKYLNKPIQISLNKSGGLSPTIDQIYYTVKEQHKDEAIERILQVHTNFHGIIFCQTKAEVNELTIKLQKSGNAAESIHGDRTQFERESVLQRFRNKEVRVLVATDVAARGLDIKNLTHVINHSLPWDVESYIHRIGRTGRAGQKGSAFSLVSPSQVRKLARIQKETGKSFTKGEIPTSKTVAYEKVERYLSQILGSEWAEKDLKANQLSQVQTLIHELLKNHSWEGASTNLPDILARFVLIKYPDLYTQREVDLDYMPGREPFELNNRGYSNNNRDRSFSSGGRSSGGGNQRSYGGGGRSSGGGDRERGGGYGGRTRFNQQGPASTSSSSSAVADSKPSSDRYGKSSSGVKRRNRPASASTGRSLGKSV